MEGMMVLYTLLIVVALVIIAYIVYAIKNRSVEESEPENEPIVEEHPVANTNLTKGRVWGSLGMLYMAGYALYIQYVIDSANVTNLGEAIGKAAAYRIFQPFFYIVLASALLSFVGVVGKNKICILLALTATIGAVFILPGAFNMLLIPAVLFLISYLRMAK
jgi:hypothetical protein